MTPRSGLPLVLLALACYAKKADDTAGPMTSTGLPIPDGGVGPDGAATGDASVAPGPDGGLGPDGATAGDASVAPGPDSGPPGDGGWAGDLAGDRGPSAQVMAYLQFLDEQYRAWSTRFASCFNTTTEALSPGRSPLYDDTPDQHSYSLDHGLVSLDEGKVKACLDALRTMSCEWLAGEQFRDVCGQVLVGKVASGGFCASPHDCQSASETCQQRDMPGCSSRCAPVAAGAALGETCLDRACAAGGACYVMAGAAEARCHAVGAVGASCPDRFACAAGTWCQPDAPAADPGTCRALQVGLPCAGSWQCPYAYACVIPPGAGMGTCHAGHKLGEACALHGREISGGPFSDCANSLFCYPDAANQYRCGRGRELGESCADVDVGGASPLTIPCRLGACRPDGTGKRTCQLDGKLGAACSADLPCEGVLGCIAGKCTDTVAAVGARCTADGTYSCAPGARCAISAITPTEGLCVRLKVVGESCGDPAECAAGAACVGGVCSGCK